MRFTIPLIFLAIISSTGYGQVENPILLPLGTPQQIVADSVQEVFGLPEAPDPWDMLALEGQLFGLPTTRASIKVTDGKLESIEAMIELDTLPTALDVQKKAIEYLDARLNIKRLTTEFMVTEEGAGEEPNGNNLRRWKVPDGYVILDCKRITRRKFTIQLSRRLKGF